MSCCRLSLPGYIKITFLGNTLMLLNNCASNMFRQMVKSMNDALKTVFLLNIFGVIVGNDYRFVLLSLCHRMGLNDLMYELLLIEFGLCVNKNAKKLICNMLAMVMHNMNYFLLAAIATDCNLK